MTGSLSLRGRERHDMSILKSPLTLPLNFHNAPTTVCFIILEMRDLTLERGLLHPADGEGISAMVHLLFLSFLNLNKYVLYLFHLIS
jgi:hypothetical protein